MSETVSTVQSTAQGAKNIIRMAELDDCQKILDIYSPYIEQTAITLTSRTPSLEDVAKTMADIKRHYPYLVCCIDGELVGFAFAYRMRPQEAYRWSAEINVYIAPDYHGKGIATALYTALFQILKTQGFCNLYAVITLPSKASVALHEHFGFTEMCVQKAVGYKLGEWRDVLWMEWRIEGAADPSTHGAPLLLQDLNAHDIDMALAMASTLLMGAQ
ncbi:MAG: N-acetyltransferase family protein [Coriobacteriia bacterium]|nr:N-acetyltransferase family protein [Coriobacteriia bacterium]